MYPGHACRLMSVRCTLKVTTDEKMEGLIWAALGAFLDSRVAQRITRRGPTSYYNSVERGTRVIRNRLG